LRGLSVGGFEVASLTAGDMAVDGVVVVRGGHIRFDVRKAYRGSRGE
jgi:hypothetical protein